MCASATRCPLHGVGIHSNCKNLNGEGPLRFSGQRVLSRELDHEQIVCCASV